MSTIDHSNPLPSCKGPDCRALQTWREKCREAERRLEIAEKAALACPKPLVWTDERPKKSGWYWWRDEKKPPTLVYIGVLFEERLYREGQWAGPIPEPVEPKE